MEINDPIHSNISYDTRDHWDAGEHIDKMNHMDNLFSPDDVSVDVVSYIQIVRRSCFSECKVRKDAVSSHTISSP
jgi:hypothetical protein